MVFVQSFHQLLAINQFQIMKLTAVAQAPLDNTTVWQVYGKHWIRTDAARLPFVDLRR